MTLKLVLASTLLILSGCNISYRQAMLPDGNTWQINASEVGKCSGFTSEESCVRRLRPRIEERARELCGREAFRIFGCEKLNRATSLVGIGCKVACNAGQQIQILGDSPLTSSYSESITKDTFEKAKKCQQKGGVWLNGGCQIEIE